MTRMKTVLLAALCGVSLAVGCSDSNEDGNGSSGGDGGAQAGPTQEGSASFEISGDINASRTGTAQIIYMDNPGTQLSMISVQDDSGRAYTLSLAIADDEVPAVPAVGTYSMGVGRGNFGGTYRALEGENNVTYQNNEGGGTLVVTESTSTMAKGTFEFTARVSDADGDPGNIEVTNGQFTAYLP